MFIDSSIKNSIQDMGINIFLKNYVSSTNDYIQYKYIKDQTPVIFLQIIREIREAKEGHYGLTIKIIRYHSLYALNLKDK